MTKQLPHSSASSSPVDVSAVGAAVQPRISASSVHSGENGLPCSLLWLTHAPLKLFAPGPIIFMSCLTVSIQAASRSPASASCGTLTVPTKPRPWITCSSLSFLCIVSCACFLAKVLLSPVGREEGRTHHSRWAQKVDLPLSIIFQSLMFLPCLVHVLCKTRCIQVNYIGIFVFFVHRTHRREKYRLSFAQILSSWYQS